MVFLLCLHIGWGGEGHAAGELAAIAWNGKPPLSAP
jgi:hypothetical protein